MNEYIFKVICLGSYAFTGQDSREQMGITASTVVLHVHEAIGVYSACFIWTGNIIFALIDESIL